MGLLIADLNHLDCDVHFWVRLCSETGLYYTSLLKHMPTVAGLGVYINCRMGLPSEEALVCYTTLRIIGPMPADCR